MAKKKKKLLKGLRGPSYFIGGIIAGFGAKKRAKEGEAKAREAMAAAAAQREAEKANRQTLALSPEVEKLKEGLGGDEIQRRQEAAERMRAGATAAATRGGSRVDPFAAAQAGSQAESQLATDQAAAQRSGLAAAQTERADLRRIQEARSTADIAQAEKERLEGRTDVMSAQQSAEAARQQIYGGIDAGIGLATSALSDKKDKKNIKKVGKTNKGVPVSEFEYKDDKDAPKGPGKYKGVIAQDLLGTKHEGAIKKIGKNTLGVNYGKLDVKLGKISSGKLKDKMKKKYKKGGMPKDMMEAGEAEVTPGKFSHEKNPIDLVQRDGGGKGEKIGEMTGGEAIVPPKNVKQIRNLIREKDGDELVSLMDRLLTKWDKEAEENNKKEARRGAVNNSVHKPRLPRFKKRSSIIS